MLSKPIYMDYNATTPVDPAVLEAMLPYFKEAFGNAASTSHAYGWEADGAVKRARKQVSELMGCQSSEIYFTSGATESNNLALQGTLRPFLERGERAHLITTAIEHKCVLEVAQTLERWGAEITYLKPNREGLIEPKQLEMAIEPHTRLISIIHAQNEIGSIQNLQILGGISQQKGVPLHVDAAQSVGKIHLDLGSLCVDMLSASSQKMYGPKGVGFLYVRKNHPTLNVQPIMFGGTQESGLRPGTHNVPGIVGLGKACEIAQNQMAADHERVGALQEKLIAEALSISPQITLNGPRQNRLYSNVSLTFKNLNADIFALGLSGLAVSTSSACAGGAPSHVLKAIGLDEASTRATVRFGLGRFTKASDIDFALSKIRDLMAKNTGL